MGLIYRLKAGIHKKPLRITNREVWKTLIRLKKKQSDLGLHCLSRPFLQATNVGNFRTFTAPYIFRLIGLSK